MSDVTLCPAGRDFSHDETLDVPTQVELLIKQATSHENLCQCYIGWWELLLHSLFGFYPIFDIVLKQWCWAAETKRGFQWTLFFMAVCAAPSISFYQLTVDANAGGLHKKNKQNESVSNIRSLYFHLFTWSFDRKKIHEVLLHEICKIDTALTVIIFLSHVNCFKNLFQKIFSFLFEFVWIIVNIAIPLKHGTKQAS